MPRCVAVTLCHHFCWVAMTIPMMAPTSTIRQRAVMMRDRFRWEAEEAQKVNNGTRLPPPTAPAPPHLPPRELERDVGLWDVGVPVGHLAAVAHRARLGVVGRHEVHLMGGEKGRWWLRGTGERARTRCRSSEGAGAAGRRRGPPGPHLDVDGAARPELGGDRAELERREAGVAARPRRERPGEEGLQGGEGRGGR